MPTPATVPFRALLNPETPTAGGSWNLKVEAGSHGVADLRGLQIRLLDDRGEMLAELDFSYFDGKVNRTREITLQTPEREGVYAYTLDFPEQRKRDLTHPASQTPLPLPVQRNTVRPSAWQLPIGHPAGELARVRIGAKGGDNRSLAGQRFEVLNALGVLVVEGVLGNEPWPETQGTYSAEAALPTANEPGVARYTLRIPPFENPLPHAEGSIAFSFPTAPAPSHDVVVSVIDHLSREPLAGAHVVMHPFRSRSDRAGVARVRVSGGIYTLFVSHAGYDIYKAPLEVVSDHTHQAELVVEVEADVADQYA